MPDTMTHEYAKAKWSLRLHGGRTVMLRCAGDGIPEPWLFGWPEHAAFQRFAAMVAEFAAALAAEDASDD